MTLQPRRLRHRQFTVAGRTTGTAACADAGATRQIATGPPQTPEVAWRRMASFRGHCQLRGHGMGALKPRDTGVLLSRVGLIHPPGWPGFEPGRLPGSARLCKSRR